ncbi:MAG TPA: transcriptional regulator [Chloroflexi bacterium]|nr:transcriptional regulator [Chloroflexota bacterium]
MTETVKQIEEKLTLRNRILGLLLRNAREQAEKTKRECADALGVSSSTITAFEDGRKPISLPELEVLAYLVDTPIPSFWDPTPELAPPEEHAQLQLEHILALRHRIIGTLLRQARLEANMTQNDLAEVIGCSSSTISSYEYGERPIPLAELEVLADRLDVPTDYFLDQQDGSIGAWHQRQKTWRQFNKLDPDVQNFVIQPINIKYLEVAMKLAEMPAGALRDIAAGLLDITY